MPHLARDDALAATVERYLSAIGGASMTVRRRERANCQRLLAFLDANDLPLEARAVEAWLDSAGPHKPDARRRRLTTVRRLLALTPGAQADNLSSWIDANRDRLIGRGRNGKVVALHPVEPGSDDREQARRIAEQGFELFEEGDLVGARALARRAIKIEPSCLLGHALLGQVELEDNRPDAALRQFRQALVFAGDPGERDSTEGIARVLDGLGKTLLGLGCLEEAYEVYRRLRHASEEWSMRTGPVLGRTALLLDQFAEAAEWFGTGEPLDQYNAAMARLVDGDIFRAAIALCRGLLVNPFVVPEMLHAAELRFASGISDDRREELGDQAKCYSLEWGGLWARRPGLNDALQRLWDQPALRTFLMRALPIAERNPASPRLAVLIHQTASTIQKSW